MVLELAHKFLRGCGWFAVTAGGGCGLLFALMASHESGWLEPQIAQQIFTHGLLGRLPTLLVAAFLLLRVNFQLATDVSLARRLYEGRLTGEYVLACALACIVAWLWFSLCVLLGSWLGVAYSFSGYAQAQWNAYANHLQFTHLFHAGVRMMLLAAGLSALTFFEVRFLQSHEGQQYQMMSRAMTLGVVLIAGIEAADFLWMLQ